MDPITESKVKFTDTIINEQIQQIHALAPSPPISDLAVEDFDALNQIMNEIAELNNTTNESSSIPCLDEPGLNETKSPMKPMLNRMDSVNLALGDFFLDEFDVFCTEMSHDPMIGNNLVSNPLKMIF
jgi:hypothetical protein